MVGTVGYTVVDAHTHVIEHMAGIGRRGEARAIGNGRVRWLDGEESRLIPQGWGESSFTHERLIAVMDEHGISKSVMMQGSFYGYCNDYTFEAQQRFPDRLYGMGTFDPYAYEAPQMMKRLVAVYGFRGFKFEISRSFGLTGYHPDFRLDGKLMAPVWEFAQEQGLIVSLDLGTFGEPSFQVDSVKTIARDHPNIRLVVEHLFYPGPGRFDGVRAALSTLASSANVSFTIASIPNSTMPEPYPFPSACRYAAIARDVVGAERILWGSDLPSVAVNASYRQLIDYVAEAGPFTDAELRMIYAENAVRLYRMQEPAGRHG